MSGLGRAVAKVGTFRPWHNLVLTVGTGLGVVCIVATIVMVTFGYKPLSFRSGFMSPAMDTGPVEGPGSGFEDTSTDAEPRRHGFWKSLRSDRVRALLSLGIILGVGSVGTLAYWTDDATASGATFSSGTIDLLVSNEVDDDFAFSTLSLSLMVPGSTTAGVITVKNEGTAPFKFTVTSAATNVDTKALKDGVVAKVTTDAAVTGTGQARTCASAAIGGSGTTITAGLITTGRQLAGGASETLCFQVALPTNVAMSLQNASTTATLTFTATSDLT